MRREYHSWFHGRQVPTNGIAGVAVAAERRGAGLLDDLMAPCSRKACASGARSSRRSTRPRPPSTAATATSSSPAYDTVEIADRPAGRQARPRGHHVRRATAADFDAVRRIYATWAAAQNGPLTRTGASFPADADEFVAVVHRRDARRGRRRGRRLRGVEPRLPGYDATATVEIADLVALTRDATSPLWRLLGSFATVTGQSGCSPRAATRPACAAVRRLAGACTAGPTCCACTTWPAPSPGCPWTLTPDLLRRRRPARHHERPLVADRLRRRLDLRGRDRRRPDLRTARPRPVLRRRRVLRRPADGRPAHGRFARGRPRDSTRSSTAAAPHPRLLLVTRSSSSTSSTYGPTTKTPSVRKRTHCVPTGRPSR